MRLRATVASLPALALLSAPSLLVTGSPNVTYTNSILPGFFTDPSCIFAPDHNNTFLCASSSFLAFPGIPIHASKDLTNWKLIGHAFNRALQYLTFSNVTDNQFGVYAPTIRYHDGLFYISVSVFGSSEFPYLMNLVFNASDPFDNQSWAYDTSLYWEENVTVYDQGAAGTGIVQWKVDMKTGAISDQSSVWNGTGGVAPEGPHVYKKDGYYYLMIAEGGSGDSPGMSEHHETIARSKNIIGPYESNSANPILSNINTTEYFTGTGHADLFQDAGGNWWGVALATRGGPLAEAYPMGRETVLFPVSWKRNAWPVLDQVRGVMSGPLPPRNLDIPGDGHFQDVADIVDFEPGSRIPNHSTYWRFPIKSSYLISPPGHPNTLRLTPSALNLTGYEGYDPTAGQTFIARRQTDTLFTYSIDVNFFANATGEETGVSLFLTQDQHLDLGLVIFYNGPQLRFRGRSSTGTPPADVLLPVDSTWLCETVRFQIRALNETHFSFSAGKVNKHDRQVSLRELAIAPGSLVSGGYTGTFVGAYVTTNGGNGSAQAYVSRWRYIPQG